ATVNFFGNNATLGTAVNQLLFTAGLTAPQLYVGNQGVIMPFAEVNGISTAGDFATYGGTGVIAFTNYLQLTNSLAAAAAGDIVNFNTTIAAPTLNANQAIGALRLNATTIAPTLTLNGTLTIASGALLSVGNILPTITGGTALNFGTSEGILFTNNSANTTI